MKGLPGGCELVSGAVGVMWLFSLNIGWKLGLFAPARTHMA